MTVLKLLIERLSGRKVKVYDNGGAQLTKPILSLLSYDFSIRDIVFIVGGAFLFIKTIRELQHMRAAAEKEIKSMKFASYTLALLQIMLFDIVFSLDSVITAIGIAKHYVVMAIAVILSVVVVMMASGWVSRIINNHPRVKVFALSFLLLIGGMLMLEGFGIHVVEVYVFFVMGFAILCQWITHYCRV